MAGWGDVIGKIFDWVPGRKESYKNRIETIKREMYEIQNKKGLLSARDAERMRKLADELSVLLQKVGNAS